MAPSVLTPRWGSRSNPAFQVAGPVVPMACSGVETGVRCVRGSSEGGKAFEAHCAFWQVTRTLLAVTVLGRLLSSARAHMGKNTG